ncbi:MAG: threonylcarbamoyl-AMP synthase [Thiogranum sp.]|jgi:tRNA threonylcarbamoyl adenosine modification protein (Sua5/YciO/YrdC/YwlC family)|nr:threonylcarbamoyl-AMP synthase [Thiogranum sp.]
MSQFFALHPDNPQARLIRHAVDILRDGGVAVVPTDSTYAIVCHLDDKGAVERIQRIRQLDKKHNFTLLCRDLSEIATYARVDNTAYRLLKARTPGAYTFLLRATAEVPRRLQHPKRKTIGIRVPDNAILQAILIEHGQPLMSTSLILPGRELPEIDAEDIRDKLEHQVDLIIDGGHCGLEPTTVVDLTEAAAKVIRQGRGSSEGLE